MVIFGFPIVLQSKRKGGETGIASLALQTGYYGFPNLLLPSSEHGYAEYSSKLCDLEYAILVPSLLCPSLRSFGSSYSNN